VATAQNNLGLALAALGKRENGTARLEQAVAAFRAALEEWTRARAPLQWATAQDNLAVPLSVLGERESSLTHFQAAHDAVRGAYEVYVTEAGYTYYNDYFLARLAEIGQQISVMAAEPVPPI
jgi:tetratricopeptide (TPR) repeat protein